MATWILAGAALLGACIAGIQARDRINDFFIEPADRIPRTRLDAWCTRVLFLFLGLFVGSQLGFRLDDWSAAQFQLSEEHVLVLETAESLVVDDAVRVYRRTLQSSDLLESPEEQARIRAAFRELLQAGYIEFVGGGQVVLSRSGVQALEGEFAED